MTLPSALNDRLIFAAYFIPSPVAWVLLCLSEPAKSTKFSFPALNFSFPNSSVSSDSIWMVNILWDLDDYLFMAVYLTALFLNPMSIYLCISASVLTIFIDKSLTKTPLSGDYLRSILALMSFPNKSWIYSLYISIKLHRTKCFLSVCEFVNVIIWWKVLGIIPFVYYASVLPIIVWVLPQPVCPYAKIVPLYPSSTLSTNAKAVCSYT